MDKHLQSRTFDNLKIYMQKYIDRKSKKVHLYLRNYLINFWNPDYVITGSTFGILTMFTYHLKTV